MPSDPRGAFIAHSNYLLAFDLLIRANDSGGNPFFARPHQVLTSIVDAVRASSSFGSLRPQASGVAFPALRSALRNAWGTELLLLSTERSAEDDLIGVANNWAVVQALLCLLPLRPGSRGCAPATHPHYTREAATALFDGLGHPIRSFPVVARLAVKLLQEPPRGARCAACACLEYLRCGFVLGLCRPGASNDAGRTAKGQSQRGTTTKENVETQTVGTGRTSSCRWR